MANFSTQLRELRKKKSLTQADLARSLQIAQTTIANYEQGTRFPDELMLNEIADFFGISIDVLLGRNSLQETLETKHFQFETIQHFPWIETVVLDLSSGSDKKLQEITNQGEKKPLTEIYDNFITPIMYETGRLWESGHIDVYEEHVISETIRRFMVDCMRGIPLNKSGPRFLGITVSGELHEIGLRMVTDLLQSKGWYSLFLGTNIPTRSLLTSIEQFKPAVIGISVGLSAHLSQLENMIFRIRSQFELNCPKIMVGGQGINNQFLESKEVKIDAYAQNAEEAMRKAHELIGK